MASDTGTPALASLCSTNSSAPRLSGALPGSTSTAVINWGVGVHHHRRLMPVKAPALALVAVAHLGIVDRHHPVLAHSIFEAHLVVSASISAVVAGPASLHVLEQQLCQQLRRVN